MSDKPGRSSLTLLNVRDCLAWLQANEGVSADAANDWLAWLNVPNHVSVVATLDAASPPNAEAAANVHAALFTAFGRKKGLMQVLVTPAA